MTRILLPTLALLLTACAPDAQLDTFDGEAVKGTKYDVCHHDGDDGSYDIINISENAVDAHVDNHGDWVVTEEVCGDGIDNDCDGEIDEDCCPCDLTSQFATYGGSATGPWDYYYAAAYDQSLSYDFDSPDNTDYPEYTGYYNGDSYYLSDEGYNDYFGGDYSYSGAWGQAIYEDYDYTYTYSGGSYEYQETAGSCYSGWYQYDGATGDYTSDYEYLEISVDEVSACQDQLADYAADNGITVEVYDYVYPE